MPQQKYIKHRSEMSYLLRRVESKQFWLKTILAPLQSQNINQTLLRPPDAGKQEKPLRGRLHSAFSVASLMYDKPSKIVVTFFQVGKSHCRGAVSHASAHLVHPKRHQKRNV
jgi:hypothetical protein